MSKQGERNRRRREREEQQRAAQDKQNKIDSPVTVSPATPVAGQVSPSNDSGTETGTREQPNHTEPQPRERWRQGWNWKAINAVLTLAFAAALVAFTGFQVYFGMLQWDATDKQWKAMLDANKVSDRAAEATQRAAEAATESNKIARDNSIAELRAYVAVDTAVWEITAGSTVGRLAMNIKNYGPTPAYDLMVDVQFKYLDPPFTPVPVTQSSVGRLPRSNTTLGGGATGEHHRTTTITEEEMERLKNGTKQLQIFGYLSFDDVFGDHHMVEYRLQWGGQYGTDDLSWEFQGETRTVAKDPERRKEARQREEQHKPDRAP